MDEDFRDLLAMIAMHAMVTGDSTTGVTHVSRKAYLIADTMIKEREKYHDSKAHMRKTDDRGE